MLDLKLMFPFDGMDFASRSRARSSTRPRIGRTGVKYADVQPEQQRLLRYILDSYLGGEIISTSEILDLQKRSLEAKPRSSKEASEPKTFFGRLAGSVGSIIRSVLATLIVAALVAFVGSSILNVSQSFPPQSGYVTIDLTPVVAGVSGTVTNIASGEVTAGQPIATILTANGNSQTQLSPCDCLIDTVSIAADTQVGVGDTIALMQPVGQRPYVVALVDRSASWY